MGCRPVCAELKIAFACTWRQKACLRGRLGDNAARMNFRFIAFFRAVSISGLLWGISFTLWAEMPKDLSPDERTRYEQGEALDKAIALYGLATLRHYSATVVSIKTASTGSGLDIELKTKAALRHEAGKPWYDFESQPIASRSLHWHWPDARPAPACVGFEVEAYADGQDNVQRISKNVSPGLVAMRRMTPNGSWEILIACTMGNKRKYLVLQPDHLNIDGFELEWTAEYGLALSVFQSEYGDGGEDENENHGSNWPGWSLVNIAGQHVRPGREGWERIETITPKQYSDKTSLNLVPAGQYIGDSDWLNPDIPWSP